MSDERSWMEGNRAAWVSMLQECLKNLRYGDKPSKDGWWILEREQVIASLRRLCGEYGDNDWTDDLHLADVISKHLEDYLESSDE